MSICDKDLDSFLIRYDGNPKSLKKCGEHGIALFYDDDFSPADIGVICEDWGQELVISTTGGTGINKRMFLCHTPHYCREGIGRASR